MIAFANIRLYSPRVRISKFSSPKIKVFHLVYIKYRYIPKIDTDRFELNIIL